MLRYVQKDLLETDCDIIAHGVNCSGGFASGVAGQIAKKFPLAKEWYLAKYHDDRWELGHVQFVPMPWSGKIIANCATQKEYGRDGKVYVDYGAVKEVMHKLYDFAKSANASVGIPKIGAGLAGGDWQIIEAIIEEVFHDREIVVHVI
jgi:O-acetyl-ADP-ribose deacetylase (regulator of RNase III)